MQYNPNSIWRTLCVLFFLAIMGDIEAQSSIELRISPEFRFGPALGQVTDGIRSGDFSNVYFEDLPVGNRGEILTVGIGAEAVVGKRWGFSLAGKSHFMVYRGRVLAGDILLPYQDWYNHWEFSPAVKYYQPLVRDYQLVLGIGVPIAFFPKNLSGQRAASEQKMLAIEFTDPYPLPLTPYETVPGLCIALNPI